MEYSDSLYLSNDTTINNKTYKTILSHFQNAYNGLDYGYVREDSSTGKAWFVKQGTMIENFIYDLGLIKGDTFQFNDTSSYLYIVDTVFYKNSRKHLSLTLLDKNYLLCNFNTSHQDYDSLLFIEGIGSSRGFDNRPNNCGFFNLISDSEYLLCASQNGQKVYQHQLGIFDSHFLNCDFKVNYGTSIDESTKQDLDLKISPNPSQRYFKISTQSNASFELIKMMDIHGKEVEFNYERIDNSSYLIDLGNLPVGIYLIKTSLNNEIQFGKLILNQR